jgi:hypothetical protein
MPEDVGKNKKLGQRKTEMRSLDRNRKRNIIP